VQTRFETDQERYRYARPTDLGTIVDMLLDEEVGRWLWFVPASRPTLESYLRPLIEQQWQSLADGKTPTAAVFVAEDAEGTYLGQLGAMAVEGSPGGFEIGFQLLESAWGRGVGTRAGQFLAAWAIHAHGAYRIEGRCLEGNEGSQAILTKLGLQREGRRPGYRLKGDVRHTELEFGAEVEHLDRGLFEDVARSVELI
jgi:RimJ/RimL family protein N-acetyltransferase